MAPERDAESPRSPHAELSFDFCSSSAYVAQTFLGNDQHKRLCNTLAGRWGKLNSLSAAKDLMKAHGVELTQEEEEQLHTMDEAAQISTLVGKMPMNDNEEFQLFFLKLQLLVGTATTLRQAIDDGCLSSVKQALQDSESTGVSRHILRVALVQAANQAEAMTEDIQAFSKEAAAKIARLMRGQQDWVTAQKRLAAATEKLTRMGLDAVKKTGPMIEAFASRDNHVLVGMTFRAWAMTHAREMMERRVEEEFTERAAELEERLVDWKAKQFAGVSNAYLRRVMEANARFMADMVCFWRAAADSEIFARVEADRITSFDRRLAESKESTVANAKRMVQRMQGMSAKALFEMCLGAWKAAVAEETDMRETQVRASAFIQRAEKQGKDSLAKSKNFIQTFLQHDVESLQRFCLQGWLEVFKEAKRAEELASLLQQKQNSLSEWGCRSKDAGASAMEKAAEHISETLLLRTLCAWKIQSKMALAIKAHHSLIEGKRKQLQGVQHLFRSFAEQLDAGIAKDTAHDALFDRVSRPRPRPPPTQASLSAKAQEPRLSKAGSAVSLPNIGGGSRPPSAVARTEGKRPPSATRADGARSGSHPSSRCGSARSHAQAS